MKFKGLIVVLCVLSSLIVNAQELEHNNRFKDKLALKVEYFGELVLHPGIVVGFDYTVVKKKWVTIHWDADLGGYWHRWNNTSAFVRTTIGSRFAMGPVFADINIGAGYMHQWAAGDVYVKGENGGVKRTTNWGHPHFMPSGSLLLGWDGGKRNNLPWTVYLGPEVYLQSNFNHIFLPHAAAKVGFTYKIN